MEVVNERETHQKLVLSGQELYINVKKQTKML
jgi:hypothetical protein